MAEKPTLLVTGASGFLGWNICRAALKTFFVVGIHHSRLLEIDGVIAEKCDLTDLKALKAIFKKYQPTAIIHAAAMANPNECQQDQIKSSRINVTVSHTIALLCNEYRAPCVFTSTDLVFDGTAAPYDETCPVSPISTYGEHKVLAEQKMRESHDLQMICRMPLMYGDAPPHAQSFIHPFIRAMKNGSALTLFTDEFRTPISGRAAANGLLLALKQAPGLLHLGGRESISRYDFCRKLAGALGTNSAKLVGVRQASVTSLAPRPLNVSFTSEKAYALGFDPMPIDAELKMLDCIRSS